MTETDPFGSNLMNYEKMPWQQKKTAGRTFTLPIIYSKLIKCLWQV